MTPPQEIVYEYSSGNLLENRNTYFYTPFHGKAFLAAWRYNRQSAADGLPEPRSFDFKKETLPDEKADLIDTDSLLNHLGALFSEGESEPSEYQQALLNRLVMKFEVSKRIYESYTQKFQPIDKAGYKRMELYVQFAATVSLVYQRTAGLPYLNVMIKCIDTLISCRGRLRPKEAAVLADLINQEYNYIVTVAEKAEVEL